MSEKPETSGREIRMDLASEFSDRMIKLDDAELAKSGQHRGELADLLLREGLRAGASDIHLEPHRVGTRVRFRIDGVVWDVAHVAPNKTKFLVNQLKALAGLDPVTRFTPKDAHASYRTAAGKLDLRMALAPSSTGETMSIRLLDERRLERSILDLGLRKHQLEVIKEWLADNNGMFLSAGPTGSGKTTTIYALLHEVKSAHRVIVSLEDPVEYQVDGITQIQIDELHQLTFAQGAKAMLRLDPDYLMMGEVRDALSAAAAVTSSLSGRILLSTIHARDAIGAVSALRNWNLPNHEIAEALGVIVAQRLVRKLCQACRRKMPPSDAERRWLEMKGMRVPAEVFTARGCKECRGLGYKGRTGIFEVWRLEEADYEGIISGADEHALRRDLGRRGHEFVITDGLARVAEGNTSLTELRRVAGGGAPVVERLLQGGPAEKEGEKGKTQSLGRRERKQLTGGKSSRD